MEAQHGVKVGLTRIGPEMRRHSLEAAVGLPIALLHSIELPTAAARRVEIETHEELRSFRMLGEWFSCSPIRAIESLQAAVIARESGLPSGLSRFP